MLDGRQARHGADVLVVRRKNLIRGQATASFEVGAKPTGTKP